MSGLLFGGAVAGEIRRSVGAKLAGFLQLAFLMISAPSGDW